VTPSINILGSFFPAWLICVVVGLVLTIVTRQVLVATRLAPHVGPPPLVYPCLAAGWMFATWLIVFAN
jgi:YtcA family